MAIEFMLAHELAWRIAAPGLLSDGRATMPENVGLALLLGAIPEAVAHADTPDYLRAAATTAGFGPAALRTIEDLAAAALRPQALEATAHSHLRPGPPAADGAAVERASRPARPTRASWTGPASTASPRQTLPSPLVGAVVVCGFEDASPAESAFLAALSKHHALAARRRQPLRRASASACVAPASPERPHRQEAPASAGRRPRRPLSTGSSRRLFDPPGPQDQDQQAPQPRRPRPDRPRPLGRRRVPRSRRDRAPHPASGRRGRPIRGDRRPAPEPRRLPRASRLRLRPRRHRRLLRRGRPARGPGGPGPVAAARPRSAPTSIAVA